MIFFFDECVSPYTAAMLGQFDRDHEMRASSHYFNPGTPDTEWMPVVASWDNNVVVVSGDGRILRNRVEKRVLKDCGRSFVCLAPGWTKLPWKEYAWKIVKVWPDITKNIEEARFPIILEVSLSPKVQTLGRIDKL
jgi:hypothetical protein